MRYCARKSIPLLRKHAPVGSAGGARLKPTKLEASDLPGSFLRSERRHNSIESLRLTPRESSGVRLRAKERACFSPRQSAPEGQGWPAWVYASLLSARFSIEKAETQSTRLRAVKAASGVLRDQLGYVVLRSRRTGVRAFDLRDFHLPSFRRLASIWYFARGHLTTHFAPEVPLRGCLRRRRNSRRE